MASQEPDDVFEDCFEELPLAFYTPKTSPAGSPSRTRSPAANENISSSSLKDHPPTSHIPSKEATQSSTSTSSPETKGSTKEETPAASTLRSHSPVMNDHNSSSIFEDLPPTSQTSPNPKDKTPAASSSSPAPNSHSSSGPTTLKSRPQQIQEQFEAARLSYDTKHYVSCRTKCDILLRQPNLPPLTRCLTLQLYASCSYYYTARSALEGAVRVACQLGDLDPHGEIKTECEELLRELEAYEPKKGEERVYIREFEVDDDDYDEAVS